ncbi:MAG: ABC transporter substrate-binding protein [Myxococcota bacterium]|nr:ABC transporter substrate-binding protein [Myxococcota bacterium]
MRQKSNLAVSEKQHLKQILSFIVIWIAAAVVITCSDDGTNTNDGDTSGSEQVTIGAVLPFTGGASTYGPGAEANILLAASVFDDAGGLLGNPVSVQVVDGQSSDTASKAAAEQLYSGHQISALLGAVQSNTTLAIAEATIANKVVHMSGTAAITAFSSLVDDGFFFRTGSTSVQHGKAVAREMYNIDGHRTLYVIASTKPYTAEFATGVADEFQALGGTLLGRINVDESTVDDTYDYSGNLNTIAALQPDATLLSTYPPPGIGYLSNHVSGGQDVGQWYITSPMRNPAVIQTLGANVMAGMKGATYGLGPKFTDYMNLWNAEYPNQAGQLTHLGWNWFDVSTVIMLAIAKAGSADSSAIRDAMHQVAGPPGTAVGPADIATALQLIANGEDIDYVGASGEMNFDANGNPGGPVDVFQFQADGTVATIRTILFESDE